MGVDLFPRHLGGTDLVGATVALEALQNLLGIVNSGGANDVDRECWPARLEGVSFPGGIVHKVEGPVSIHVEKGFQESLSV